MHLVHYNAKYGSLSDAVNKKNGLAVIGILFDVSLNDDFPNEQCLQGFNIFIFISDE